MIGICTDSSSQIPLELSERYGIEVVPLTVIADGHEYLEGVDLDADGFYMLYEHEHRPEVTFAEPSPGQFALAYENLAARGCSHILSLHTSAAVAGTMSAARLAAHSASVPVRLVDPGTARFGVACCVWAAAQALAGGATLDEAADRAEMLVPSIGNVFVIGALKLTEGRGGDGISILSMIADEPKRLSRVTTVTAAIDAMISYTLAWGHDLNVAVGTAHKGCLPIGDALAHSIGEVASIREVVQFRIGPSVGVETGPGTVGCIMYPAEG